MFLMPRENGEATTCLEYIELKQEVPRCSSSAKPCKNQKRKKNGTIKLPFYWQNVQQDKYVQQRQKMEMFRGKMEDNTLFTLRACWEDEGAGQERDVM